MEKKATHGKAATVGCLILALLLILSLFTGCRAKGQEYVSKVEEPVEDTEHTEKQTEAPENKGGQDKTTAENPGTKTEETKPSEKQENVNQPEKNQNPETQSNPAEQTQGDTNPETDPTEESKTGNDTQQEQPNENEPQQEQPTETPDNPTEPTENPEEGTPETPNEENPTTTQPEEKKSRLSNAVYILHAGGVYNGYSMTNSMEALTKAYDLGFRYFEVDIQLTSDNQYVLLHDWNANFLPGYESADFPLTFNQFMDAKIFGELTPVSLNNFVKFLKERPDAMAIIDCKADYMSVVTAISRRYSEIRNQFVIQAYNASDIEFAENLGYKNILLTLYALPDDIKLNPDRIREIVNGKSVFAIAYPKDLCSADFGDYTQRMKELGLPLYIHPIYGIDELDGYMKQGISGFYYCSDLQELSDALDEEQ